MSVGILLASFITETPIAEMKEIAPQSDLFLYIIRHGQSTSNVPDPETGIRLTSGKSLTIPLTETGKKQAAILGQILNSKLQKDSEIVICSSTALRAQKTAESIFDVLKQDHGCLLDTTYEGLCELGQGSWEGIPKNEAYQKELKNWEERSAYDKVRFSKVESGESFNDVTKRTVADLDKILQKYAGKIIFIVSHYTAMHATALKLNQAELSKEPSSKLPKLPLGNCDMMIVKVPQNKTLSDARVISHINSGLGDE